MAHKLGSSTHAAFAGAVLIGGANFVAVTFSNMEMAPVFGAMVRFTFATVLFLMMARVRRVPAASGREAAGAAIYGLLGFGVAYAFLYYALVGLHAGTVAVIVAAVPLFTLLVAVLTGQERLTARGLVGSLLAIAGIAVLSRGTLGGELAGSYLLAAILAAVAIAASSVVARAFREVHPVNMNGIGMASGTAFLGVASLMLGEPWRLPREPGTWLAVGWLVVLGSVGLFQLFLYVIRRWTASATVYAVTAMPVVAAGLGVILLDQPITLEVLLGGSLVMIAVYVGAIARRPEKHSRDGARKGNDGDQRQRLPGPETRLQRE